MSRHLMIIFRITPSQSEIGSRRDTGLPRALVTVGTMNSCERAWTVNAILANKDILTMGTINGCGSEAASNYMTTINRDRRKRNTLHNNQSGLVKNRILKR